MQMSANKNGYFVPFDMRRKYKFWERNATNQ